MVLTGVFAGGWLPLTTILLLAWPEWSFWYAAPIVDHPEWALAAGVTLELAGFAAGLALASRLGLQGRRRVLAVAAMAYVVLLVAPWGLYGHVGTPGAHAAGEAPLLWQSPALVVTLTLGGGWLLGTVLLAGRRALPVLAVLALPLVGCGGEGPPSEVQPVVTPISLAVAHDASLLADRWRMAMADVPAAVPPVVKVTDEGLAFSEVIEGRVDAALVLRGATAAEDRYAAGDDLVAAAGLHYEAIARVPVIFLVHESNPVEVVPVAELKRVLAGTLREWTPLGGPAAEIGLYGRADGTATAGLLSAEYLGGAAPTPQLAVLPSDSAVALAVANDPLAIGVGGGAPIRGTRSLTLQDGEALLMPGAATSGRTWPMVRDLYVLTRGEPSRRVRAFIDYARSPAGGVIAEGSGFFAWTDVER